MNDNEVTAVGQRTLLLSCEEIVDRLRRGKRLPDHVFDRFLSKEARSASTRFWTPLHVAARVGAWVRELGMDRLVDVGAGTGKFCVIVSLVTDCQVVGVEQRPHLVREARKLAQAFGVEQRIEFVCGALGLRGQWPRADAYYFYNPFGENVVGTASQLDQTVELNPRRFQRDVEMTERFLQDAPLDTVVIDYNGFGGTMPASYEVICENRAAPFLLRAWKKRPDDASATDNSDRVVSQHPLRDCRMGVGDRGKSRDTGRTPDRGR